MKENKVKSVSPVSVSKIFSFGIFLAAFYNFVSLWWDSDGFNVCPGIACVWYAEWSYFNEPTILLVAASFLLFDKKITSFISSVLSGFVFAKGVVFILSFDLLTTVEIWARRWQLIRANEIDVLKEWEIQLVLALIMFIFGFFSFIFAKTRKIGLN